MTKALGSGVCRTRTARVSQSSSESTGLRLQHIAQILKAAVP